MSMTKFSFSFIEREIRKKTFGILNTLNLDGTPHTTGILYAVSKPDAEFALYLLTSKKYKKIRNIKNNPKISFIIPFPHHHLRFVPSGTITLNGIAKLVPLNSRDIIEIFFEKRILKLIIADINFKKNEELVFIKIEPDPKISCFGVGFSIWKLRGSHTEGRYFVTIPPEK
ncbi:MAG: pyridoxamine 5'-phosphate oxidase family protein [Candidatus Heimdallarchaeota archaeon]|nr:pyridoxamine 5'-phosphate oxidase family protein [Candidatus Heimdallarchaeota archaeon]MCK4611080.1 pyridoxamine 5'-phosphate oxidase family protein [Candidatus Heimdallarchaeota archaeon]